MPRPNELDDRRRQLLPIVAEAFSDLGYRGATTAALAQRCEVRENILYRLWNDKQEMFLDSIDYLFGNRMDDWQLFLNSSSDKKTAAEKLVEHETKNLGNSALYRIVFAALSETDTPEIRHALRKLYRRYHSLILEQVSKFRESSSQESLVDNSETVWGMMGLITIVNIMKELGLESTDSRKRIFSDIVAFLLTGKR